MASLQEGIEWWVKINAVGFLSFKTQPNLNMF